MTQTGSMGVISAAAAAPQAIWLMMGVLAPFGKSHNGMWWGHRALLRCTAALVGASAPGACRLVERRPQSPRQLQRVVMRPKMHEDQPRLLGQHVAMDRSDLDAVVAQRLDDRVHFVAGKDEITGDGGLPAASRLEVDGGGYAHGPRGTDLHPSLLNGVAPRNPELIRAAIGLPLAADDLVE